MEFIKKYRRFFSDVILNMIGFGIYVVSQQIIFLPILAKNVDNEIYAMVVLYLSVLNVVSLVTGSELGNVRLIRDSEYKKKNLVGDFSKILVVISPIIAIIVFPILIYLKYSVIGSIFLILTILFANVRLYATCYYRLEQKFEKVIYQNLYYFLGIIITLIVFNFSKNIYILLLIPETLSVIYALKNSDLLKMRLNKTEEMSNTVKNFSQLGFVSFLTNMINYLDKFLIYPMFGATNVAIYYAANSMSKVATLVTNPMSSVILAWVSDSKNEKSKNKIIKATVLSNIPVILLVTIVTMPLTYIALKILYSQYLKDATILIIPISLATAFSTAATIVKSVVLKYCDNKKIIKTYLIYFIVLAVLAFVLSKKYNLVGFAIAKLISIIILWGIFIILLVGVKKEKTEEENEISK